MNAKVLLFLILLPVSAAAQGYAGLGATAEGFARVTAPADLACEQLGRLGQRPQLRDVQEQRQVAQPEVGEAQR